MVDTIGAFYATPFGVVRTTGWDGKQSPAIISWVKISKTRQFNNFYKWGSIAQDDTSDWKKLNITDFPESVDARLPYVFDLLFDIKAMSQLRRAFRYENKQELLELMRSNGIRFKKRKEVAKKDF